MNANTVFAAISKTWPPSATQDIGAFRVPVPDEGGNRVSAARLIDPTAEAAIEDNLEAVEEAMKRQGRAPLFQVTEDQGSLSAALDRRGYITRDATDMLVIRTEELAAVPPPVTAFTIWPPLAIQTEIWEAGGVNAPRRAVMDRADFPKTSLFGRINDKPAGTAFIAQEGDIAMLHALEIAPSARRAGLASTMMRAAASWAEKEGAKWFSVLVTQQNTGAQRLYASLGLKPVGTYRYRESADGATQ